MKALLREGERDLVASLMLALAVEPERDLRQAGGGSVQVAFAAKPLDQFDRERQPQPARRQRQMLRADTERDLAAGGEAAGGAGDLMGALAQGDLAGILYVDGAVGQPDKPGHLVMNGREVFRHAVTRLAEAVGEALVANGLTGADVDWLVPHQANMRIIEAVGRRIGLPAEKVVVTVDQHANTSAASIPLALAAAYADGRIRPGQLILMEALGGGLTWGSALIRL